MKAAIITFPGSNCDKDIGSVLEDFYSIAVEYVWHKNQFSGVDLVVLPGGFSYGDYLRCGAMARFSPVMDSILDHIKKGGKVLGICNGFQILTEARILPGALIHNVSLKYICKDTVVNPVLGQNSFWKNYNSNFTEWVWPIAHGEGRYYAEDTVLEELEENGQIVIRYKENPNGSLHEIAGICSKNKMVVGMMPHPERAMNPYAGLMDGKYFFDYFLEF